MKSKKFVYSIDYTLDNLKKFNEEYFFNKGINAKVYLLLNPRINTDFIRGGGTGTGGATVKKNVSLSIPYQYFDQLIRYITSTKEGGQTQTPEYEKSKQDKSIFMEAIDKVQIMVNYLEEKIKGKPEVISRELTQEEKKTIFDNKKVEEPPTQEKKTIFDDFENNKAESKIDKLNSGDDFMSRKSLDNKRLEEPSIQENSIRIESEQRIPDLDKPDEILKDTREYKLLYI